MRGASSANRRILLTYELPIPSASEISVTELYTSSSSSFCQRHARTSGFDPRAVRLELGRLHNCRPVRRDNALAAAAALERHGDAHDQGAARRTECTRKSVSIATMNTSASSQLARPCSPSPPRGTP